MQRPETLAAETRTRPLVAVLPYKTRLGLQPGRLPLDRLTFPLGAPDTSGLTLADLTPDDHLIVPPSSDLYLAPFRGLGAKVSVLFLEPRGVHARHMRRLRLFHRRFHRILTGDATLLATLPNALFFPVGGCWVPDHGTLDLTKRAMCSLIASNKARLPGHRLRHALVRWCRETGREVAVMGRGYRPFAEKSDGLAPFRYSLVIENTREQNYFSEKLVDAVLCQTVPIYWGCPNIGDFFDTRGMILCETEADIRAAVAGMSQADYEARRPGLVAAGPQAVHYGDIYGRAARALLDAG
jgi:hypothetical protein